MIFQEVRDIPLRCQFDEEAEELFQKYGHCEQILFVRQDKDFLLPSEFYKKFAEDFLRKGHDFEEDREEARRQTLEALCHPPWSELEGEAWTYALSKTIPDLYREVLCSTFFLRMAREEGVDYLEDYNALLIRHVAATVEEKEIARTPRSYTISTDGSEDYYLSKIPFYEVLWARDDLPELLGFQEEEGVYFQGVYPLKAYLAHQDTAICYPADFLEQGTEASLETSMVVEYKVFPVEEKGPLGILVIEREKENASTQLAIRSIVEATDENYEERIDPLGLGVDKREDMDINNRHYKLYIYKKIGPQ